MKSWLRVVLPPTGPIVVFVVLYALFEGAVLAMEWRLGQLLEDGRTVRTGVVLLGMACAIYGAFRVEAFHPFLRTGYRNWLKTTPWTSAKLLPLGPIHFVWQDAVMLAALGALGWFQRGFHPLWVVPLVGAGWLVAVGVTFRPTGVWGFNYAVWFGLGLMVLLGREPVACAVAAVGTYGVAFLGLRRSLAHFPWEGLADGSLLKHLLTRRDDTPLDTGQWFGWPFDQLRPRFPPFWKISLADAVLTSLLAGWWLYVLGLYAPTPEDRLTFFSAVYGFGLSSLALGRIVLYCVNYWPPLSLMGRIRTGRWVIPGYDRVFLAPLGTLLVAVAGPLLIAPWGIAPAYTLSFSLGVFVVLGAGPTLTAWRLTGSHRIVSGLWGSNQKGGFLKVG